MCLEMQKIQYFGDTMSYTILYPLILFVHHKRLVLLFLNDKAQLASRTSQFSLASASLYSHLSIPLNLNY